MKLMRTACIVGALALGVSTASADKVAPPAEPTAEDLKAFLKFFDGLANIVVADKADCTKMAADVNKDIDDNKAMLEKAKGWQSSGKQMPADVKQHVMETAKKMTGAMMEKCSNDKGVQAAFERLPKHGPPAKH
jgi:hypothetical protein